MITYEKLWKKMEEQNISQYRLHAEGISNSTLTRLRRNEPVNIDTINKLLYYMPFSAFDIARYPVICILPHTIYRKHRLLH